MSGSSSARVLLTDDDPSFAGMLGVALESEGYEVQIARNGLEGLQRLFQWRPDLVILDALMPRMDGWETCQRMREVSDVPILMLTAKSGEAEELKGLRAGADQYITKPFAFPVLLASIRAILRRSRLTPQPVERKSIEAGRFQIDLARHEAFRDGRKLSLTRTEFRLLAILASRAGEVVTHRELLEQVWGPEYVDQDSYLKIYIRYLRQKVEGDPGQPAHILTKRGVGYYFSANGHEDL